MFKKLSKLLLVNVIFSICIVNTTPDAYAINEIKVIASDGTAILFPCNLPNYSTTVKQILKKRSKARTEGTKLDFSSDTLMLLDKCVRILPEVEKYSLLDSGKKRLDQFMLQKLVKEQFPQEVVTFDKLNELLKSARFFNINPLVNLFSYFMAERICNNQHDLKAYTDMGHNDNDIDKHINKIFEVSPLDSSM